MKVEMILTPLLLLAAAGMDLRTEKISNRLIVFGLAAGIGLVLCGSYEGRWYDSLAGALLPVALCWILFRIHAVGAGDIKLFSVIGCLNGVSVVINSMAAAFFIAAVYALIRLIGTGQIAAAFADLLVYGKEVQRSRELLPYEQGQLPARRMHFSPAIFLGYCIAFAGVDIWTLIS